MPIITELGPIGFLAIALAFVVAAVLFQHHRTRQHREALLLVATRHGLDLSIRDPFGLTGLPFAWVRRGDDQEVTNVLHGSLDGEPVQVFELACKFHSTDAKGHRSTRTERYTCAVVGNPGVWFPHLQLSPETLGSRLKDAVGMRDIQFESDAFNRAWDVRCDDRRFAYALIDPRVMDLLLAIDDFRFELNNDGILVVHRRVAPEDVLEVHRAGLALRDALPAVARELYPGAERER